MSSLLLRRSHGVNSRGLSRLFSVSAHNDATYGFIGLGRMGYPMAKNLRSKLGTEDSLVVNDINPEVTSRFKEEADSGCEVRVASSPREVAENAETIVTALPEPSHVRAVFKSILVPQTLLKSGISNQRLFIDCSTIDLRTSKEVADSCVGQGRFVDAPMSGGVVGAEGATLTFMLGCPNDLIEQARDVLTKMGRRVVHLGPPGSGLKGKLANNYLLMLNNIATCEAMNMGVQWGLDPKALADMINTSTGKCWPSEVNNPVPGVIPTSPASKGYDGGFGISLASKDFRLAVQAAEEAGIKLVLGQKAKEVYQTVETDPNCKGKDFSVIYRYLGGKE